MQRIGAAPVLFEGERVLANINTRADRARAESGRA
jgi:molybdopterin-guanine dinucleotide biosynthesis protein A